jgi:DNA-binding Xre family transcriptional regulator
MPHYRLDRDGLRRRTRADERTQTELAVAIGCSVSTLNAWQNGAADPSMRLLLALCDALHCKPGDLLVADTMTAAS